MSDAQPIGSATEKPLDGRYIIGALGCDLAADPIGRQSCIADVREKSKVGLSCERPDLLIVAIEPHNADEAVERIRAALDPAPSEHETSVEVAPRYHPSGDEYTWATATCEDCDWTAEGDESDVRDAAWSHRTSGAPVTGEPQ